MLQLPISLTYQNLILAKILLLNTHTTVPVEVFYVPVVLYHDQAPPSGTDTAPIQFYAPKMFEMLHFSG